MEDFPRAQPAPAANTVVKVSLDEWAVVRRDAHAELMTDGLNGCVALSVKSGDKMGLTHVYSGAADSAETFAPYRQSLKDFMQRVGAADAMTEVHIMSNGNPLRDVPGIEGRTNLPNMIRDYLVSERLVNPDSLHVHRDNGCTLTSEAFYSKTGDTPAIYIAGHTNTALEGLPIHAPRPAIDAGGFAHSRDYAGPCDAPGRIEIGTAHALRARFVPDLPEREPVVESGPPMSLVSAVREKLPETGINFGFQRTSVAGTIATAAHDAGITGEFRLGANADKTRIALISGEQILEFNVNGKQVSLVPAVAVPVAPLAQSSTPHTGMAASSSSPPSLYQQAFDALAPYRETLGIRTEQQVAEGAREIASQASHNGLSGISRLEAVIMDSGKPGLVAHQGGAESKQAPPIPVETLQHQAGVATREPMLDAPQKGHFPIM